jgi:hypothetical protein
MVACAIFFIFISLLSAPSGIFKTIESKGLGDLTSEILGDACKILKLQTLLRHS